LRASGGRLNRVPAAASTAASALVCIHIINLAWYDPPVTVAQQLIRLLDLDHPPVAITFYAQEPSGHLCSRPAPAPAGCCFWQQAEQRRLHTTAADHAHCSVGS